MSKIKSIACAVVALVSIIASTAPSAYANKLSQNTYIGGYWGNPASIPSAKLKWTSEFDSRKDGILTEPIAAGGGQLFVYKNNRLTALSIQTGKTRWTSGKSLSAPVYYDRDIVYSSSKDGTIHALSSKNGSKKWASGIKIAGAEQIVAEGDRLLVLNREAITALDRKSGKVLWQAKHASDYMNEAPLFISGNVVIRTIQVSGALTHNNLLAYDLLTGTELWIADWHDEPLAVRDNLVYTRYNMLQSLDVPPYHDIDLLDLKTGEKMTTRTFKLGEMNAEIAVEGDYIYVSGKKAAYRYSATDASKDDQPKKYSTITVNGGTDLIIGPYRDRLFFLDKNKMSSLSAVKTANGQASAYNGTSNPISRVDLVGNGVYVGQTDGTFIGFNLETTKPLFKLVTKEREYGATIATDGVVIVRGKTKLYAVEMPVALK